MNTLLNSKSSLVVYTELQNSFWNFKIAFKNAFNSVGAIIFTFWDMGNLEKGCLRLNVFVKLLSWIYAKMKRKKQNAVIYIEVDCIETDNGLLLRRIIRCIARNLQWGRGCYRGLKAKPKHSKSLYFLIIKYYSGSSIKLSRSNLFHLYFIRER